jgi:2-polyprenyl-3-methyl-5-hydroxy-6-metoxy-1,4-benzoquinol methylase
MNRKEHWENVYTTKALQDVSWYQPLPGESLAFMEELQIPPHAAIIDIGGGDSLLADHLLDRGYTDITVLDISAAAIERAKKRLGNNATAVKWIVTDITAFKPERRYDFWHDRAAFHFLTREEEVNQYLAIAGKAINPGGKIVIGTFAENGPEKCSGLPVKQYSESALTTLIKKWFEKIRCVQTDHLTPFNTIQHFIFCSFKKFST